jgi:hypothetical protein
VTKARQGQAASGSGARLLRRGLRQSLLSQPRLLDPLPGPGPLAPDPRHLRCSQLITNNTSLNPGQVEVLTTANVSMGLRFAGAKLGADPAATSRALRAAFADLALGFDSGLIRVSPHPEIAAPGPVAGAVSSTLLQGAAPLALASAGRRRALLGRRALRGAAAPAAAWGQEAYAAFTGLSPSSVQMLTNALELNCGEVGAGDKLPGAEPGPGLGPPGPRAYAPARAAPQAPPDSSVAACPSPPLCRRRPAAPSSQLHRRVPVPLQPRRRAARAGGAVGDDGQGADSDHQRARGGWA